MQRIKKTSLLFVGSISLVFMIYGAGTGETDKTLQKIATILENAGEKSHPIVVLDRLLNGLLLRTSTKKVYGEENSIPELYEVKLKALITKIYDLKKKLLDNAREPYVRYVNAALSKIIPSVNERSPSIQQPLTTGNVAYFAQSLRQLEKNICAIETHENKDLKKELDKTIQEVAQTFHDQAERITMQEHVTLHAPTISALVLMPAITYLIYKKVPIIPRLLTRATSYIKRFFVKPPALELSPSRHITFKDIVGLDTVIKKLKTIVGLHLDPKKAKKAQKMGVTFPRGILFEGPPGVGKTMLAKAFANELGSNFFYASASDFHGKWLGEGKEKLTNFFSDASAHTPAVIFIDEIDAIGTSREEWTTHQDTKATLNELLIQMDGFKENPGIIVLAATNRASSLDTALLTRFSEKISFFLPDFETREKILIHYMNQVPSIAQSEHHQRERFYFLAKLIAQQTAGFSPRELQHFINNTVRRAFTEGSNTLTDQHFIDTLNDTLVGAQQKK